MRKALAAFHLASACMAAAATVMIAIVVFVQVGGRMLGVGVRGADDLVAWLTACACLAGIGYAFRVGSHVRVELVVDRLAPAARRPVLLLAAAMSAVIATAAAWACASMVIESYTLGDVSQGDIPVKLWIPQLGVAVGAVSLALAVLEHLVLLACGGERARTGPAHAATMQEI